jgi:hypothetical protein
LYEEAALETVSCGIVSDSIESRPAQIFAESKPGASHSERILKMTLFGDFINPMLATPRWINCGEWKFEFAAHSVFRQVHGVNVVYAFVRRDGYILYIGRAEILSERLRSHDKIKEAISQGATELWVHSTNEYSPVNFHDVEEMLIKAYCPPLNKKHNTLAGLLASSPRPQTSPPLSLSDLGRFAGLLNWRT